MAVAFTGEQQQGHTLARCVSCWH